MANSLKDALSNFFHALKGIGKSPDKSVLRAKAGSAELEADANAGTKAPEKASEKAAEKVSGPAASSTVSTSEADRLSRVSNNRLPSTVSKDPKNTKEQWNKIKKSAKDVEPASGSIEHWAQKSAASGILSGTTFDAATTEVGNGPRAHKRPTMVTQARITHGRLQALQAKIEQTTNEFDKANDAEEEQDYGGHGH